MDRLNGLLARADELLGELANVCCEMENAYENLRPEAYDDVAAVECARIIDACVSKACDDIDRMCSFY